MSHPIYQRYESSPVAITDTVQNQLPDDSRSITFWISVIIVLLIHLLCQSNLIDKNKFWDFGILSSSKYVNDLSYKYICIEVLNDLPKNDK